MAATSMRERRAELLDDLAAQTSAVLATFGLAPEVGEQVGHAVADHMAEHWGGQVLNIPKDHAYKLSLREREIVQAHRGGKTFAELAIRYNLSERAIRRLLKRAPLRAVDLDQATFDF